MNGVNVKLGVPKQLSELGLKLSYPKTQIGKTTRDIAFLGYDKLKNKIYHYPRKPHEIT